MVKSKIGVSILIFLAFPMALFCQEVKVAAEIEGKGTIGMPVNGTITVTHDQSLEVDIHSFRLGDKLIEVEFLKDVKLSPNITLIISIYNFSIEPQPPGLHILPEVSVTVGGKVYRSIPSTYEVDEEEAPTQLPTGGPSVMLRFETIVDGDTTIYPGQRINIGYRFIFNYSIDLTREEIPLLEAKGFRKIGGKETKEYTQANLNYLEITQMIEALEPGEYSFELGVIQGRAYRAGRFGQKEYARSESRAESSPVTIHVLPFPEQGKPPSFNGALGESLTFDLSLLTPDEVAVGDKSVLFIKITGKGELASLPMPEVCCQPGFSGFFRISDLPPIEELFGSTKTFKVEMRPLNDTIKEIPSLEFSYFNPKDKSYIALQSAPIPIKVTPLKTKLTIEQRRALFGPEGIPKEELEEEAERMPRPEAIEIEGSLPLTSSDLENKTFGTWWVLLIIPFGIGAVLLQIQMRRYVQKRKQMVKKKRSKDLFQEALQEKPGSSIFFHLLNQAFLLRLVERGDIASVEISLEKLPEKGATGKVRAFLRKIEEKRFSGKEEEFGEKFLQDARKLFKELGTVRK